MKDVVFIAYLSNYGGIESFIIRMTRWLHDKKYCTYVIGDADRNVNVTLVSEVEKAGAEIIMVPFRKKTNELKRIRESFVDREITCITFSYPGIILADVLFAKRESANIIFYDPHQFGMMMDYWASNKKLKPLLRIASKFFGRRLYNNHQVIFMDRLCKTRTLQKFNMVDKYDDDVVFLPMIIEPFNEKKILQKIETEKFEILSVCRMTFPFKGYVFGLIDIFEKLIAEGYSMSLTLIGTGDGDRALADRLEKLEKSVRGYVTWIPGMAYEQLSGYFEEANVYVGMGTTIVDAVNRGVPALPVGSYSYECKGYSYFHGNPENLGGLYGEKDISESLLEIYNMNEISYLNLCRKDYDSLKTVYDIENAGQKFLSYKNNCHWIFNDFEKFIVSFIKKHIM